MAQTKGQSTGKHTVSTISRSKKNQRKAIDAAKQIRKREYHTRTNSTIRNIDYRTCMLSIAKSKSKHSQTSKYFLHLDRRQRTDTEQFGDNILNPFIVTKYGIPDFRNYGNDRPNAEAR